MCVAIKVWFIMHKIGACSVQRSRQSSGGSGKISGVIHRRTESGESRRSNKTSAGELTDVLLQRHLEEVWHVQLRQSFMQEFMQYMTSLGYAVIRTRPLSPKGYVTG